MSREDCDTLQGGWSCHEKTVTHFMEVGHEKTVTRCRDVGDGKTVTYYRDW